MDLRDMDNAFGDIGLSITSKPLAKVQVIDLHFNQIVFFLNKNLFLIEIFCSNSFKWFISSSW